MSVRITGLQLHCGFKGTLRTPLGEDLRKRNASGTKMVCTVGPTTLFGLANFSCWLFLWPGEQACCALPAPHLLSGHAGSFPSRKQRRLRCLTPRHGVQTAPYLRSSDLPAGASPDVRCMVLLGTPRLHHVKKYHRTNITSRSMC